MPDYSLLERMRDREKLLEEMMRSYIAALLDIKLRDREQPVADETKAYRRVERWYNFWQEIRCICAKKRKLEQR